MVQDRQERGEGLKAHRTLLTAGAWGGRADGSARVITRQQDPGSKARAGGPAAAGLGLCPQRLQLPAGRTPATARLTTFTCRSRADRTVKIKTAPCSILGACVRVTTLLVLCVTVNAQFCA